MRYDRLIKQRIAGFKEQAYRELADQAALQADYGHPRTPIGIVEEISAELVLNNRIMEAIEGEVSEHKYRQYEALYQDIETVLLKGRLLPNVVKFADEGRQGAYQELISLRKDVERLVEGLASARETNALEGVQRRIRNELNEQRRELVVTVRRLKREHPGHRRHLGDVTNSRSTAPKPLR